VDLAGRERRVVAADGDERGDAELVEHVQHVVHAGFGFGRVGARGAEDRAATQVDGLHILNRELRVVAGVALSEPLEAVLKADDFEALINALNCGRSNDAVDAGRGSAADQDAKFSAFRSVCHIKMSVQFNRRESR
jgi:hypothetical protein